ncbi:MAG: hypothetical protein V4564_23810 [Pseudomonadota bacterium]
MSDARIEWRGDLFATDLSAARAGLWRFPVIARPWSHTITLFLHPAHEGEIDLETVIRLRSYCDLPTLSADAVANLLRKGLAGKLQRKESSGTMRSLGDATLCWPDRGATVQLAGMNYRPGSVRVSERVHYSLAADTASSEAERVTVDLDRHLFRLTDDGLVRPLGQLGPRLEFKGPTQRWIERSREVVDADALARRRPNRALELLFQDMLRDRVLPAPESFPEVELKFDVDGVVDAAAIDAVERSLGEIRLLLPPPHRIERMRRYHLCRDPLTSDACTVVETPSGRLSAKRKRNARSLGAVLLRDTSAMHATDRDGVAVSLGDFLRERGWIHLATFEKTQTKIPFSLPSGRAYLISVDHCFAGDGRTLDQIELEFIGSVGTLHHDSDEVAGELEELARRLGSGPLGARLALSTRTKHGFFGDVIALVA